MADRRLRLGAFMRPVGIHTAWWRYPGAYPDANFNFEHLKRFGSVTILNGHIHQIMQKIEGNVTFHTAMSTAFPQPAPGTAPSAGPMKVPDDQLRKLLGTTSIEVRHGDKRLALTDSPLAAS